MNVLSGFTLITRSELALRAHSACRQSCSYSHIWADMALHLPGLTAAERAGGRDRIHCATKGRSSMSEDGSFSWQWPHPSMLCPNLAGHLNHLAGLQRQTLCLLPTRHLYQTLHSKKAVHGRWFWHSRSMDRHLSNSDDTGNWRDQLAITVLPKIAVEAWHLWGRPPHSGEQDFYLKYGKAVFPKCVLHSQSLWHVNRCYFPRK